MTPITIPTAALILGRTTRTVWRQLSDGTLRPCGTPDGDRMRVSLEQVVRNACVPIEPEDYELIIGADAGSAEAQCDLALLFLMEKKPDTAVHLLTLAAKQDYPEALYQLARCHIAGTGTAPNGDTGIMWLARAASRGHAIARASMQAVQTSGTGADLAALDAMLEDLEKRLVTRTLNDTAS